MKIEQNKTLLQNARTLRKNMTKEERHLWYDFLSTLPIHFRRQQIIGNYITDFYCDEKKLVVELDGSQHYEKQGQTSDKKRDQYLEGLGLTVLRYSNEAVMRQFRAVCEDILKHLD